MCASEALKRMAHGKKIVLSGTTGQKTLDYYVDSLKEIFER